MVAAHRGTGNSSHCEWRDQETVETGAAEQLKGTSRCLGFPPRQGQGGRNAETSHNPEMSELLNIQTGHLELGKFLGEAIETAVSF